MHVVYIFLFCVAFGRFARPEDELDAIVWGQPDEEIDLDEVTIGEERGDDLEQDFRENLLSEVGKNGLSPEILLALKDKLENADEAHFHRKGKGDDEAEYVRSPRKSKTTTTEPALKMKPEDGEAKPDQANPCEGPDKKCGDDCTRPCPPGAMCPTVKSYCQADGSCGMKVPECDSKGKPESGESKTPFKCPPGHTMRNGKCQSGKGVHLDCPEGKSVVCDKRNPRKCRCEISTMLSEKKCPHGKTFRNGKCVSAKISHLQKCPPGEVVWCMHHNPRMCKCVSEEKAKGVVPLVKCGKGTKEVCTEGKSKDCVCEIIDNEQPKSPRPTEEPMLVIPSDLRKKTPPNLSPPIWSLFHNLKGNLPGLGWDMPQNLQCRRRVCKALHGPVGMQVQCKCMLTPKKKELSCKPQYKKVCKGDKCACYHKCDLRNIMRRCECDKEDDKQKVSDPGTSLVEFCDMTRRDFCQRQCRPCSDLECKYADMPLKQGKSNIGVFIAAKFRQEYCQKTGCDENDDDDDDSQDDEPDQAEDEDEDDLSDSALY